jgi:superfamily II DNA or RNA helicase
MQNNPFQNRTPMIAGNLRLRTPQREAYAKLAEVAENSADEEREFGIVLPVGCGKSGCIALAPFAFRSARALVVAPGVRIAEQLQGDFDPTNSQMFYIKCGVIEGSPYPEPVGIRGTTTNIADIEEADVVITNIQQLQREENRWLKKLKEDFFDLILFDEGHRSVADSWDTLRNKFPNARIVNFSATPLRADGQLMAGKILYHYPVFQAIQEGYVKRLKAVVLNPRTLRYVRHEDDQEIEVSLEEVRRLGEEDASFRRSIVTSAETLNTIADASIRELSKLRNTTGDKRLKIIASALNFQHCVDVVKAYRTKGLKADYVHSKEDAAANKLVMKRLEDHELDVIVQVRKLGEGFDHPHLAVAAIFSIFANLSPFVQFVGRIMRVIKQDAPLDPLNRGIVVFHAGANIARQWEDFQEFSQADQAFYDQLLPMEGLDFSSAGELEVEPYLPDFLTTDSIIIRNQTDIELEEIPLLADDPDALAALQLLQERGYSSDEVKDAFEKLVPVPSTKVKKRQAMRSALDQRVRAAAGRILKENHIKIDGHELDRKHLGRTNFVVLKAAIDQQVSAAVKRETGERHEFDRKDLALIEGEFKAILERAVQEVLCGQN